MVKILFIVIGVAIIAVIAISYSLYSSLNTAHPHDQSKQFVVIEKGLSTPAIIDKLAERRNL